MPSSVQYAGQIGRTWPDCYERVAIAAVPQRWQCARQALEPGADTE